MKTQVKLQKLWYLLLNQTDFFSILNNSSPFGDNETDFFIFLVQRAGKASWRNGSLQKWIMLFWTELRNTKCVWLEHPIPWFFFSQPIYSPLTWVIPVSAVSFRAVVNYIQHPLKSWILQLCNWLFRVPSAKVETAQTLIRYKHEE